MAKQFIIQVYGWVGDGPCPVEGQYVERFDPKANARAGEQCMWFTPDIAVAKKFDRFYDAAEYWRMTLVDADGHALHRPDGRPDRPLTAFHVNITEVPEGA